MADILILIAAAVLFAFIGLLVWRYLTDFRGRM